MKMKIDLMLIFTFIPSDVAAHSLLSPLDITMRECNRSLSSILNLQKWIYSVNSFWLA